MALVDVERCLTLHLDGLAVDLDRHSDRLQRFHHGSIEVRNRHGSQCETATLAATRFDPELVSDEIEIDLEVIPAIRHRPGREASCRRVERHLPAMVEPGHSSEPDLAYDLHPHVERFV